MTADESDNVKSSHWIAEVWARNREAVIALAGDGLLFLVVISIIKISDLLVGSLSLPEDVRGNIEKIHYFGYLIILTVILLGLILRMQVIQALHVRKQSAQEQR